MKKGFSRTGDRKSFTNRVIKKKTEKNPNLKLKKADNDHEYILSFAQKLTMDDYMQSSNNSKHSETLQEPQENPESQLQNTPPPTDPSTTPNTLDIQLRSFYQNDIRRSILTRNTTSLAFCDEITDRDRAVIIDSMISLFQDIRLSLPRTAVYRAMHLYDMSICRPDLIDLPMAVVALTCFSLTIKLEKSLALSYDQIDSRFEVSGTKNAEKAILVSLDWEVLKTTAGDWLELWLTYMFEDIHSDYAEAFFYGCHILVQKCLYSKSIVQNYDIQDIVIVCINICLDATNEIWERANLDKNTELDLVIGRNLESATTEIKLGKKSQKYFPNLKITLSIFLNETFEYLYESKGLSAVKNLPTFLQHIQDSKLNSV